MVDTISMASGVDPIELGVRAAQLRCLTNISNFKTDYEHLLDAISTIRESKVTLTELSPHSVTFLAEVAGVTIFARQHFNDDPIPPDALRSICELLVYVWNRFTHYGQHKVECAETQCAMADQPAPDVGGRLLQYKRRVNFISWIGAGLIAEICVYAAVVQDGRANFHGPAYYLWAVVPTFVLIAGLSLSKARVHFE